REARDYNGAPGCRPAATHDLESAAVLNRVSLCFVHLDENFFRFFLLSIHSLALRQSRIIVLPLILRRPGVSWLVFVGRGRIYQLRGYVLGPPRPDARPVKDP